jgi:hypothetical protein
VGQELPAVRPILRIRRFLLSVEAALDETVAIDILQSDRLLSPQVVLIEGDIFAGNELEQPLEGRPGHGRTGVVAQGILDDGGHCVEVALAE